jgi:hypothetical protein
MLENRASGEDAMQAGTNQSVKSAGDAKAYEPPTLVVIGPVKSFTFGSKNTGSDNGPHTKNF